MAKSARPVGDRLAEPDHADDLADGLGEQRDGDRGDRQ
jgi:hypothetical protein